MSSLTTERLVRLPPRHSAQQQIAEEAGRFNVLQCGRRFGKTTLGVDLSLETALESLPVGWFAPTYKLLDEAWRDVLRAARDVITHVDKQQRRLELIGGGVIEFWSMDHPDPGRGRKYARVVIDEAGIVKDLEAVWTQAIRPTLTDLKGDAWFLGTPKGRNYFHTLYLRGQQGDPGWMSWRFATVENPYLDPAEIQGARSELPDLAFRQEYLGEAVDDAGNPFGIVHIRACTGPLSPAKPLCWGWDLAKSVDWTVGVALDAEGHVCRFLRFQESWEMTLQRVRAATGSTPAMVDSTGVGDPVLEALQRTPGTAYQGWKFTSTSKQQLMERLAVAIQQRAVRFPAGQIVQELEAFQYEYTRTGVRYAAPEGIHDDCVMALALAVAKKGNAVTLTPYRKATIHA